FAGDITIGAESKIVAQKGGSFISLESEFFNDAGIVMENGSDRASNEKFTDDDPQNGVAEAKAALEAQMNEASLVEASKGASEVIADLSGKPLVELENVSALPEYKLGTIAPDGTRMRAVGLDGKNYPGTLYNKNGVVTFTPDNAKGYKKATGFNWDYVKTLGCSIGDMAAQTGIDVLKIPSEVNIAFSGNEERKKDSVEQSEKNIEYLDNLGEAVNSKFKEWSPYSDETFDQMQLLITTAETGRQFYKGVNNIGSIRPRGKANLPKSNGGSNKSLIIQRKGGIVSNKGSSGLPMIKNNSLKGSLKTNRAQNTLSKLLKDDFKSLAQIQQEQGIKITNKSSSISIETNSHVGSPGGAGKPAAQRIASNSSRGGGCFLGDTLVYTENGYKQIKDIHSGEKVYSKDIETDTKDLYTVTRVFNNNSKYIVHIKVNNEEIRCTLEHPFWLAKKGWVPAKDIQAGDEIETYNGQSVCVSEIIIDRLTEIIDIYNIEVEEASTYYVSELNLLVHNGGCGVSEEGIHSNPEKASYSSNAESSRKVVQANIIKPNQQQITEVNKVKDIKNDLKNSEHPHDYTRPGNYGEMKVDIDLE
ncbi:MAG: hypothetical protein IJH34_07790, partial [Romboutsia sp.]|nr:hypothetical protein [Romboutsia sp.]